MTITFENDNDIIIYTLEKIISYARRTQQIFVAHCIWWLASLIGLKQGLVVHIDNRPIRSEIVYPPIAAKDTVSRISEGSEFSQQDKVLKQCEEFLHGLCRLRDLALPKPTGETKTGHVNPLKSSRRSLRISKRQDTKYYSKTNGIDASKINSRKLAGECLRCA